MRQMLLDGPLRSRVTGRAQLVRRIRLLLVAVNRFGRGRARSRADLHWAAVAIDRLTELLEEGARPDVQDPR